jgi:hypothetical protein
LTIVRGSNSQDTVCCNSNPSKAEKNSIVRKSAVS